ncbi:MAG: hypothetical protein K2H73_00700, partial [Treponemataceae bacterium]|nr:hypothetical protein [Treponemataceae bacterium]
MKKLLFAPLVLAGTLSAFADPFTDAIQALAGLTACKGRYDTHKTSNPRSPEEEEKLDKYKKSSLTTFLAFMSGYKTSTPNFDGVCYDYAKTALKEIESSESWWNGQGMYERQYWIAGDYKKNPNIMELVYPVNSASEASKDSAGKLRTIWGGYIKAYDRTLSVKTHRHNNGQGSRATNHAWLWIERMDGVQFWIDPTWTDNVGYVVYGYVKDGEEIQCRPDRDFCINYPDALNGLPLPPPMEARKAPSKSANSTNRNETILDAGSDWMTKLFLDESRDFKNGYVVFFAGVNAPFQSIMDKSPNVNQMSFSLEMPVLVNIAVILGLEYLQNITDDYRIHGGLFTFDFTRRLTNNIAWYLGGGMGIRFDPNNSSDTFAPNNTPVYLANTNLYAFKVDTG